MATAAQILANQANAQLSTGPVTPEGLARVSQNRLTHGLAGTFQILPWECPDQFTSFSKELVNDYKPETLEEHRLVASIIQHYWLMQRALTLQELLLVDGICLSDTAQKRLSLFIRYQSANERAYYKAMRELQNLRKQKRVEQIGFESQQRKAAEEQRKQEAHEARTRLTKARAEATEIDTDVRKTVEAPLPGNTRVDFSEIQGACAGAILALRTGSST